MMGLVAQTVSFVVINVVVGFLIVLFLSGNAMTDDEYSVNFSDSDTDISYGQIKNIDDYRPSDNKMEQANIPSWVIWCYSFIMILWLSFIAIGWLRGQD